MTAEDATYSVQIASAAARDIDQLRRVLEGIAYLSVVEEFIRSILEFCQSLERFPYRGRARDDLREGVRVISYRGQTIAFAVTDKTVVILRVLSDQADLTHAWNPPAA